MSRTRLTIAALFLLVGTALLAVSCARDDVAPSSVPTIVDAGAADNGSTQTARRGIVVAEPHDRGVKVGDDVDADGDDTPPADCELDADVDGLWHFTVEIMKHGDGTDCEELERAIHLQEFDLEICLDGGSDDGAFSAPLFDMGEEGIECTCATNGGRFGVLCSGKDEVEGCLVDLDFAIHGEFDGDKFYAQVDVSAYVKCTDFDFECEGLQIGIYGTRIDDGICDAASNLTPLIDRIRSDILSAFE